MALRAIFAAALLLGSAGALSQAPAPSRMDNLVESFMTIVERGAPDEIEAPFDPPELRQEILRLNPGKEQQVAEFVRKTRECTSRYVMEDMPHATRRAARALGEERLAQLVAVLEGPAGAAVERLGRRNAGTALSNVQEEELDRVMDDYRRWMYSIPNHMDPALFERTNRCHEEEAERLGLRIE